MSKRLLGIGDVYTYDYKQVHKTRNVDFDYYMSFSPDYISWEGYDVNKWWFPIRLVKD